MQHKEKVTFGGGGLDRVAHLRDPESQAELRVNPKARLLFMWRGKPLLQNNSAALSLVPMAAFEGMEAGLPLFIGILGDTPIFAKDISRWAAKDAPVDQNGFADASAQVHPSLAGHGAFRELRMALADLSPLDAELAGTARGIFEWHRLNSFCANCGTATDIADAGWRRVCPGCGRSHFPRTDPVVIMLVLHGNDVLVGRSAAWPAGMYSLLAGFVEPGETIEVAVRREVLEEAGVHVGAVDYLASQPWPFPASLMMGCKGIATSRDITIDPAEIEDALWISRERMMGIYAGDDPLIKPARKGSIAHFLIQNWLADHV